MNNFNTTVEEKRVQEIVREKLPKTFYRSKNCFAETEVETNDSKRADVLIVYKKKSGKPYCIVVEAKSRLTLSDLKPTDDFETRLKKSRTIVMVAASIIILALGYEFSIANISILLAIVISIGLIIITSLLLKKIDWQFTKAIPAINQLAKYPANEKWIAIPFDTFVNKHDHTTLIYACKKNGIGLIVMDRKEKLVKEVNPFPYHETNNFINNYKKASQITNYLTSLKTYNRRTPFENKKTIKQIFDFAKYIILPVIIFFYLNSISKKNQLKRIEEKHMLEIIDN